MSTAGACESVTTGVFVDGLVIVGSGTGGIAVNALAPLFVVGAAGCESGLRAKSNPLDASLDATGPNGVERESTPGAAGAGGRFSRVADGFGVTEGETTGEFAFAKRSVPPGEGEGVETGPLVIVEVGSGFTGPGCVGDGGLGLGVVGCGLEGFLEAT